MSPSSTPKRPLSPTSLRELSSPTALARPPTFPAPPTGHDLMLLFPPAPPALRDVDIVAGVDRPFAEHQNRLSAFQGEVRARVLAGRYVNTSTWFGKEERAFFAHSEPRRPDPPSTTTTSPVPPPAFPQSQHPQPAKRTPSPRHSPRDHLLGKPPSPPQPHAQPASATTTRRRAGKYTKRVFVQSGPGGPPEGVGVGVGAKW